MTWSRGVPGSGTCIAVCGVLRTELDLSGLSDAETLLGRFLSTACAAGELGSVVDA
jgi:hypothetical protein